MEAPNIVMKFPLILVYIYGEVYLVPRIYFIKNCQRQFLVKQRNKVENLKLVQLKYYIGTKLDISKIQNKNMGCFIIII